MNLRLVLEIAKKATAEFLFPRFSFIKKIKDVLSFRFTREKTLLSVLKQ